MGKDEGAVGLGGVIKRNNNNNDDKEMDGGLRFIYMPFFVRKSRSVLKFRSLYAAKHTV